MDLPTLIKQFGEFQAQIHEPNPQPLPSKSRVYGTILHPNSQPGVDLIVIANDCGIRAVEPLGKAIADKNGNYDLSYELDDISHKNGKSVNLLIEIFRENQLLFRSPIDQVRFNASADCNIDITLAEGDTYVENEYSRLDRRVKPVVGNLPTNELQENHQNQDMTFLSGQLQEDVIKLRYYSLARRLSSAFDIPPEFFYALFAENSLLGMRITDKAFTYRFDISLDSDIATLFYDVVILPPDEIVSAIDNAFSDKLIPEIPSDMLQTILQTLKRHESDARHHPSQNPSQPFSTLIADCLKHGKIDNAVKKLQDPLVSEDSSVPSKGLDNVFSTAKDKITFDFMGDINFVLGLARKSRKLDASQDESALAKLTYEEWIQVIANSEETTEDSSAMMSETVKIRASQVMGYMEEKHPTAAFVANMERDPSFLPESREDLLAAFSKSGFSLLTASMNRLFSSNTEFANQKPEELESQQNARQAATMIQRVFKLAPTYRRTKALIDSGIRSSAAIHAWGKERFIQHFTDQGSFQKAEAESIFERATDVHLASCFMAGEIQAITAATRVQALSSQLEPRLTSAVSHDYPNMKSLFQLGDFCACEDCRTVHSAAAYVVDTLQFLKNRLVLDKTTSTTTSAKDVLFSRRPDLGDMDLSCANTNITLPYVDLVCELLEEVVSPDPGINFSGGFSQGTISRALLEWMNESGIPITPTATVSLIGGSWAELIIRDETVVCKMTLNRQHNVYNIRRLKQTYGSAEQVASVPQYVNYSAYNVLSRSVYAFELPFDLAYEEIRAYFAQFEIPRGDLMRSLKNKAEPTDLAIAVEDLGFSTKEISLITRTDSNQVSYWGGKKGIPTTVFKNVLNFIERAVISYTDLQTLLSLQWLNPQGALSINHLDDSCDLEKKEIARLDNAALDRLHRFIRLWKRTRTPPEVLDRAIRATKLGGGALEHHTLLHIRDMNLISAQLNLSLAEVCTFYSTIPDLRYSQIFLNSAKNGRIESVFEPSNMQANQSARVKLSDYTSYIALCLGISEPMAQLIIESLGDPSVILSLDNLAAVYSLYMIAKALKISVQNVLTIKIVSTTDPLSSPSTTLDFLDAVKRIQGANISPSKLRFILTNVSNDATIQDLNIEAVLEVLQTLKDAYEPIVLSNASGFSDLASPAENKRALLDVLSKIEGFDASTLNWFSKMLGGILSKVGESSQIAQELSAKLSFLSTASLSAITAALGQALAPAARDSDKNIFIQTLIDALSAWLTKQGKIQVLNFELRSYLQLSQAVFTEILQYARLRQPASAGNLLLVDILTDDALNSKDLSLPSVNVVQFKTQIWAIRLLSVMARYLPSLELSAAQIGWLLQNSPTFEWFKLDDLAYSLDLGQAEVEILESYVEKAETTDAPSDKINPISYTTWVSFQDVLGILKSYVSIENPADPKVPFTVFGLFELTKHSTTTMHTFINYLAQLTGLEAETLDALSGHFGFTLNTKPSPFWQPESYLRLQMAAIILRKLGLELQSALSLCEEELSEAESLMMRQALKARYADADWFGVLKNVQDPIRGKKRDALVTYLLAINRLFDTSADLYNHYLIDVNMGTCMSTSRIVQAHATIQLFVQRCLMGLEPQFIADLSYDSQWSQWKWMSNFRVWQANRKIFLWPENWIDPSLRLDKSEIFQKFENQLSENPLSDEALESSLQTYLEDFEDIAQLDIMTCYYDVETLKMHVFARTRGGDPHVYYHRQLIQEREWTPWVKVDLDINGPQLLAFVHNGLLCLAWPVFIEESDPSQMINSIRIPKTADINSSAGTSSEPPKRRWKIHLAVSEYIDGKWKAKRVSEGALYHPQAFVGMFLPKIATYTFYHCKPDSGHIIAGVTPGNQHVGSFRLTGIRHHPEPINDAPCRLDTSILFQNTTRENGRFNRYSEQRQASFRFWPTSAHLHIIFPRGADVFTATHSLQMPSMDWFRPTSAGSLGSFLPQLFPAFLRDQLGNHIGALVPFFYADFSRSYVIMHGRFGRHTTNDGVEVYAEVTFTDFLTYTNDLSALFEKWDALFKAQPSLGPQDVARDPEYQRLLALVSSWGRLIPLVKLRNFSHPVVFSLRSAINRGGIAGLMKRSTQLQESSDIDSVYGPSDHQVARPFPVEGLDFAISEANSPYNWELFFHAPFEIAVRLNQDKNFESAQQWFHYIFNPIGTTDSSTDSAPQKYWITKPFFLTTAADYISSRIDKILMAVADPNGSVANDLKYAISQWRANPFQPHVIAKTRPVAYQLAVVIRYIRNLIDWGDALFREYTRESINQATQYYDLADKLLGPKPRNVPPANKPGIENYNQLEGRVSAFSDALVDLENHVPSLGQPSSGRATPSPMSGLYFCVGPNEELLSLWDSVADRLFKIRHCQDINGMAVPLALFSAPIDPGALVRVVAGGAHASSFLTGLNAPLPFYRFTIAVQKAVDLAELAGSFGRTFLEALEKKDIEAMARLKGTQENSLSGAVRNTKLKALEEGKGAFTSLTLAKKAIEGRKEYYASQDFMDKWEITATNMLNKSLAITGAITLGYTLAAGLKLIPQIKSGATGFGGSPTATAETGGEQAGGSAETAVVALEAIAETLDKSAELVLMQGDFHGRWDDWAFEIEQADAELAKCNQDIVNAELHIAMLQADIDQQDLAVTQSHEMNAFMRSKFTNQELYHWMISATSKVYFDSYQLAFDVAKQAERALQFELGVDQKFITFGWNSLRRGLLAADELVFSIRAMEMAYDRKNSRDYELTKHVSLRRLDSLALIDFKAKGNCTVQIPEAEFDRDHPGHYMRRHKSVSLSILFPGVVEPYASVNCKLTMLSNRYRAVTTLRQGAQNEQERYAEDHRGDSRFVYDVGSVQSIATSGGQSDAGMFLLDFDDKRYLPFEYTGAIATWQIELPPVPQFDYSTITDVILHLSYTARDGGTALRNLVAKLQQTTLSNMALGLGQRGLHQAYVLREHFFDAWEKLQSTASATLTLELRHLPYFMQQHDPRITEVKWYATIVPDLQQAPPETVIITVDGVDVTLQQGTESLHDMFTGPGNLVQLGKPFNVKLPGETAAALKELILVVKIGLGKS